MTRQYTKNFQCITCGAPCGRRNAHCSDCQPAARSARNKHYQRVYHDQHRPPPKPTPQTDPTLPPIGSMVYDDDGVRLQCHVCGRFFRALNTHLRTHGLTAGQYKATYGLTRSTSLLSPQTAARQRAAALARNQGDIGRRALLRLDLVPAPLSRGYTIPLSGRIASSKGRTTHD